ncbi:hypothetical protein JCM8097_006254 [Rhodosporidiobolus ruineniae]
MSTQLRADSFDEPHVTYSTSGLDYRTYNDIYYEPWLRSAYAKDLRPFYLRPPHVDVKYTTEFGAAIRSTNAGALPHIISDIFQLLQDDNGEQRFLQAWYRASVRQREDWCLRVWQHQQSSVEGANIFFGRDDVPEFTLGWAANPHNYHTLLIAAIEDAKIQRSFAILDFCRAIIRVVLGQPAIEFRHIQPPVQLTAVDRAELVEQDDRFTTNCKGIALSRPS